MLGPVTPCPNQARLIPLMHCSKSELLRMYCSKSGILQYKSSRELCEESLSMTSRFGAVSTEGMDPEEVAAVKQLSREVLILEMLKSELLERNARLERWHAEHPRTSASQSGSCQVWTTVPMCSVKSDSLMTHSCVRFRKACPSLAQLHASLFLALPTIFLSLYSPSSKAGWLKQWGPHSVVHPMMLQGSSRQALMPPQALGESEGGVRAGAPGSSGAASTAQPPATPTAAVAAPRASSRGSDHSRRDQRRGGLLPR